MKMIFRISLFSILLLQIEQGWAADWEKILDRSNDTIYVDLDSYNTSDGYPSILIKSSPKQKNNASDKKFPKSTAKIDRFQFNCKQHLVRKVARDSVQPGSNKNMMMQFRPIAVQTLEQEIETLVCQVNKMVGGL